MRRARLIATAGLLALAFLASPAAAQADSWWGDPGSDEGLKERPTLWKEVRERGEQEASRTTLEELPPQESWDRLTKEAPRWPECGVISRRVAYC